jgi:cell division protein FtsW
MTGGPLGIRTVLIASTAALLVVGVLAVGTASSFYSMRETGSYTSYFNRHLIRVALGVLAAFALSRAPASFMRRAAIPIYVISILAIAATIILAESSYAPRINGSTRWLHLGVRILPADFLRFGFVLLSAVLISRGTIDVRTLKGFCAIAVLAIVPSVLTLLQPDLSGTAYTLFVMFVVLFVAGARFNHLLVMGILLLFAGLSAVLARNDYQLNRITSAMEGSSLEQDENYQPLQARIALGSGGFAGRGLGQSRQKRGFLPEPHTDFILAVIGEESGFAGTCTVLLLFISLFYASLTIAARASSSFDAITGAGATAILLSGVLIHTMVNTGIMPVTGMPLPLVSWGGSAMIVNMMCIGAVASIAGRAVA